MSTKKMKPTHTLMIEDPVLDYAQKVCSGEYKAGPVVRDECSRHIRDRKEGERRGVYFDAHESVRAINFYSLVLRLNGGDFEDLPFNLLPWQQFVVGSVFGWKNKDGTRRFRMAYVEAGKGSGKSPLAAGIGIKGLLADNEPRAEIYAAATKKDQAMVLYRDAVAMVDLSPHLRKRVVKSGKNPVSNMTHIKSGSYFRPISSEDGQSGPRPHIAIIDEIHEHKDNQVVELLRAGTKGRRQALILMITNSGHDKTSVCYDYHVYATKVARGDIEDDAFFSYVCALDEDDDPFKDRSCWVKANPSLGVTIQEKYLEEQVNQAYGMPSKESLVRRLNFCQWVDADNPAFDRDIWEAATVDDIGDVSGLPCYLGLDLSSKRDLTALAAVWVADDGTLLSRVWFWSPGDTLSERARTDRVPYDVWARDERGFFRKSEGRLVDKGYVAQFVRELAINNNVEALAYDVAQMDDFLKACDDIGLDSWIYDGKSSKFGQGLKLVRHGQGFAGYQSNHVMWMPRSINDFEEALATGRIRIENNPCLNWNCSSAVLSADPSGNRKWDKRKATGRIDGMVALTMAVGAAVGSKNQDTGSHVEFFVDFEQV